MPWDVASQGRGSFGAEPELAYPVALASRGKGGAREAADRRERGYG